MFSLNYVNNLADFLHNEEACFNKQTFNYKISRKDIKAVNEYLKEKADWIDLPDELEFLRKLKVGRYITEEQLSMFIDLIRDIDEYEIEQDERERAENDPDYYYL